MTQILVKRDTIDACNSTDYFIPKEYELVAAYDEKTKKIIYKLGDGKTSWRKLKKITKLSQLDKFRICPARSSGAVIYLNPFLCNEIIDKCNRGELKNETE